MATIGNLNFQIGADTSGFTRGMVATKKELAEGKRMFDSTRTPAERFGSEVDKASNLLRKGAISQDTYNRRMKQLRDEKLASIPVVGKFASTIKNVHPALIATAVAAAGITAALAITKKAFDVATQAVKEQLDQIDGIAKLSDEIGIGTEALIGYQNAAALTGTSNETVTKGLQRLVRRLGEARQGYGAASKGLEAIGLSAESLTSMSTDKAFEAIADSIQKMESPTKRAAAAYALFGRQGQELMNFFMLGKEGLQKSREETERLGLSFTRLDAAKVELANDSMARLKSTGTGFARLLTVELAEPLAAVSAMLTEAVVNARAFFGALDAGLGDTQNNISGMTELVAITADFAHALKLAGIAALVTNKLATDLATGRAITSPRQVIAETKTLANALWSDLTGESWGEEIRRRAAQSREQLITGLSGPGPAGADADLLESQFKINETADALVTKLRDQVQYFGMSAQEAEILKLQLQGADRALIDQARHWAAIADQQARSAATTQAVGAYVEQLRGEERALRLTADQLKLYELAQKGADRATLDHVAGLQRHVRAMQAVKTMREEAKKLVESLQTPEQKYAETVRKLSDMYLANMLTLQQFTELKRKAAGELEKPIKINLGVAGIEATLAGSKQALLQLQGDRDRIGAAARAAAQRRQQQQSIGNIDATILAEQTRRQQLAAEQARRAAIEKAAAEYDRRPTVLPADATAIAATADRDANRKLWENIDRNLEILANSPQFVLAEADL